MVMNLEQSVECKLAGETDVLGENLPQFHFVRHKSHMAWARSCGKLVFLASHQM
jgi:hypothetical protein